MSENINYKIIQHIQLSSENDLQKELATTKRIEPEFLPLAASLLKKLTTENGKKEILIELVTNPIEKRIKEDTQIKKENMGSLTPAYFLTDISKIAELTYILSHKITGIDLYSLWKDCAMQDTYLFILNIWALQSGVYSKEEIDENFKVNHILYKPKQDSNRLACFGHSENERSWLFKNNRSVVLPFVYNNNIVPLEQHVSNTHNIHFKSSEFVEFVKVNRAIHLFSHYICKTGIKTKVNWESINKHDIKVTLIMPEYVNTPMGKRWIQPNNKEEEQIILNVKQLEEFIFPKSNAKYFNEITTDDMYKILHFLKYSNKQFIPNLAVIKEIPCSKIKNFYSNNNNKRFQNLVNEKMIEEKYSMSALVKLCLVLGLFESSEKESLRAYEFIKNQIFANTKTEDIHKLFCDLKPRKNFDKNFADFFMIHYPKNPHCFEDGSGIDYTTQIYNSFNEILAVRPEKKIKTSTNRERLTPADAISALGDAFIHSLNIDPQYYNYVKVIAKYTTDRAEILWGINELEKAKNIKPEDCYIPYIKDKTELPCTFRILEKGDPEIVVAGRKTNCCFRYYGAAETSLKYAIESPLSTVVIFEEGNSYVQGWIWYDESNQQLVIDNLEGRPIVDEKTLVTKNLMNAVIRFSDNIMTALNERGIPCNSVQLGKRYLPTSIENSLKEYEKQGLIENCLNPKLPSIMSTNIYTDAREQFTITNKALINKHKGINKILNINSYAK